MFFFIFSIFTIKRFNGKKKAYIKSKEHAKNLKRKIRIATECFKRSYVFRIATYFSPFYYEDFFSPFLLTWRPTCLLFVRKNWFVKKNPIILSLSYVWITFFFSFIKFFFSSNFSLTLATDVPLPILRFPQIFPLSSMKLTYFFDKSESVSGTLWNLHTQKREGPLLTRLYLVIIVGTEEHTFSSPNDPEWFIFFGLKSLFLFLAISFFFSVSVFIIAAVVTVFTIFCILLSYSRDP